MNDYSELQPVKHVVAAHAPERDHFSEAPEIDHSAQAPELVCDSGPQLVFSDTTLEAAGAEQWKEAVTEKHNEAFKSYPWGLSRLVRIILGWLVLLMAIAIAIGAGVGVTARNAARAKAIDSLSNQPKHGILNDSSFAALTTSNGTRHVFFQDSSLDLRQAIYSPTIQGWITTVNIIPNTTDARSHSPISVIAQTNSQSDVSEIVLIYIDSNQHLAGATFSDGTWTNTTTYLNISQFTAASTSRAISLNGFSNTANSSELLLLFEDSNGNVTGVHGTHNTILPFFTPTIIWSWEDVTNNLQPPALVGQTSLSSPFVAGSFLYSSNSANSTATEGGVVMDFFDPYANSSSNIVHSIYINNSFTGGNIYLTHSASGVSISAYIYVGIVTGGISIPEGTPCCQKFADTASIKQSDWIRSTISNDSSEYYLWVNGTTLSNIAFASVGNILSNPPSSPFPYTRLAATTPKNSLAFYLYHQINASVLAEDVWDGSLGAWSSSNINIATA